MQPKITIELWKIINQKIDWYFLILKNGVRGFMLDTYDFKGDVWLCHSSGGKCYDVTAFVWFFSLFFSPITYSL